MKKRMSKYEFDRAEIFALDIAIERGVEPSELRNPDCRTPAVCAARRELYVALWTEGFALAEVGRLLGVDHTSVLYGIRKVLGRNYAARRAGGVPTEPERYMVG